MSFKYLIPIFLDFFSQQKPSLSAAITQSKDILAGAVRDEVLALSGRLIGGLILASVIIFSLISIGQQVNVILLSMQNGPYLSLIVFTAVAIVSIFALSYLFGTKKSSDSIPVQQTTHSNIDVEKILVTFMDGLVEGMEKAEIKSDERAEMAALKAQKSHVGRLNSDDHVQGVASAVGLANHPGGLAI